MRNFTLIACLWLACGASFVMSQEEIEETNAPYQPPQEPPDPLTGNLVEWEGWSFRWQFRDIEGLMINDVYFQGRKVLKSLNLAEIYVPYAPGAPRPEDFSLGGFLANPMPLQLGAIALRLEAAADRFIAMARLRRDQRRMS